VRVLQSTKNGHTHIYLSIYRIYIASLQGNYSKALPAKAQAKRKIFSRL